jgi:hypothetical protein
MAVSPDGPAGAFAGTCAAASTAAAIAAARLSETTGRHDGPIGEFTTLPPGRSRTF